MRGIRFKLWIYTSILLSVLLLITYLTQSSIIDRFYVNREIGNVREQALKLAETAAGGNLQETLYEMNYLDSLLGGRVSFYDETGNIVAASGKHMQGKALIVEADLLPQVLKGEEKQENNMRQGMMSLITVGVPVKVRDTIKGAVFIHIPTSGVETAVLDIKGQFVKLLLISLLLSTAGAIAISRGFTKPILKIQSAAEKISKGNYNIRVDVKGRDEFHELSETINGMAVDLGKTEKLRRDFIANVSHEFRTPLGIIKAYAEALSDEVVPENEKKEYINSIIDETTRLNDMVNGILDLAKLESGTLKINREEFNLKETVEGIVSKLRIIAEDRKIEVVGEDITCKGDRELLGRALLNIIGNAIDHTTSDGEITVELFNKDGVKISIRDNGDGIEEEHLPYIFERFYRAKNTRGGSGGLGLAIAREIVRAHGGEIEVSSEKGVGTEFRVRM